MDFSIGLFMFATKKERKEKEKKAAEILLWIALSL